MKLAFWFLEENEFLFEIKHLLLEVGVNFTEQCFTINAIRKKYANDNSLIFFKLHSP